MLRRATLLLTASALLLLSLGGCRGGDRLQQLTSQLDQAGSRERAIDGLLVLIKEAPEQRRAALRTRVAHALSEAYRTDRHRGAIVSALALLRAPEGEQVFTAALADHARGGEYFEAAIRSARLIGELGLRARAPALITTLEGCLAAPRPDRNTWLERSLILALDRLADRRAVPALVKTLDGDPATQDFYLNRMAARALGKLGDLSAVPSLVRSLGQTSHGLLLLEESRRAICRIGGEATVEVLRAALARDRLGAPGKNARGALLLLGDLGARDALPRLAALDRSKLDADTRVSLGRAMLRLGDLRGKQALQEVIDLASAPLTARGDAARLLGLYGGAGDLGERLERECGAQGGPEAQVLCWRLALAHTRTDGPDGGARLDALLAATSDETTTQYVARYRRRLKVPEQCKGARACLLGLMGDQEWRVRERAALDLGRMERDAATVKALASRLEGEHDQVKLALLIGLERLAKVGGADEELKAALPGLKPLVDAGKAAGEATGMAPSPALRSRLLCLRERLGRTAGGAAKTNKTNSKTTEKR